MCCVCACMYSVYAVECVVGACVVCVRACIVCMRL